MKSTKEYDEFGPWIYIIDEEHTLPEIFMPYQNMLYGALMTFKMPINVERRDASVYMDLYYSVIAVFDTHLIILNRNGDSVEDMRISMKDIMAVENSQFFLYGKVTIYTKEGMEEIKYNTVSGDIIELFVNMILMYIDYREHSINLDFLSYNAGVIDFLFAHLISKEIKHDKTMGLAAYQPKYEGEPKEGIMGRVIESIDDSHEISCSAFLLNPEKVVILNRTSPLKKGGDGNYACTYVYLPIHNITDARIVETPGDAMNKFIIEIYDHKFSTTFNGGNKGIEELRYFLSGRDIA